jgi:hypothetical protein
MQVMVCLWLLYQQMGIAAFSGLFVTALLTPALFGAVRLTRQDRKLIGRQRDVRVKFLSELLQVCFTPRFTSQPALTRTSFVQSVKSIKLFAWENKVAFF